MHPRVNEGLTPKVRHPSVRPNHVQIERLLRRRDSSQDFWLSLSAPVRWDLWWLDELSTLEMSVHWAQGDSRVDSSVGLNCAKRFSATGPTRFAEIQASLDELSKVVTVNEELREPVRAFGGFSFDTHRTSGPFDAFGDATFIVPRWTYRVVGVEASARATLSLFVPKGHPADLATWMDEWVEIGEALGTAPKRNEAAATVTSTERDARVDWNRCVEDALSRIDEGALSKVVAARVSRFELSKSPDRVRILERLAERFPTCTRYAFCFDGMTFLGATPETLIQKKGPRAETEALAGTCDANAVAAELLLSDKDRREHLLVSEAIVEALGPLSRSVELDETPKLKALHNVVHLHTGIRASLNEEVSAIDLVEALHPTPAVGGVPRRAALEWIQEHEQNRGWYASPIGVVDSDGDGDFCVALRCALLCGKEAWAWAGAGLVKGSTKEREYDETELKMSAILDAIGVG